MKNIKRFSAILLMIALTAIFAHAQKTANSKSNKVDVYFLFIGTEGTDDDLLPLKRKVSRNTLLFAAIEEMLKEPTEDEQKLGYVSTGYGDLKFVSVKLKRGTARVDFSRTISDDYNPGDLQTLKFEAAVKKTAMQFSSVKKVIVCVNGINEFGIGLVENAPHPCPKEK